jgi:hypothetical protein
MSVRRATPAYAPLPPPWLAREVHAPANDTLTRLRLDTEWLRVVFVSGALGVLLAKARTAQSLRILRVPSVLCILP